jgi:PAS domain S-box-containing protein
MKIVIAHPNTSFIEATKQVVLSQYADSVVRGAKTLSELVETIESDAFDIVLVDSDLGKKNTPAFLKIINAIKDESYTIVPTRESDAKLLQQINAQGVQDTINKSSGYLLALMESINRAMTTQEKTPALSTPSAPRAQNTKDLKITEEDGYFVCDRRGRFLSVNNALESISRYSMQELLQLSIVDLLAEGQDDSTFLRRIFDPAIHGGQSTITAKLSDKFGERQPCTIDMRLLRDESQNGHIIGFRGTVRLAEAENNKVQAYRIDQSQMVAELTNLVHVSYSEPLNIFLRRIIEVICQVFKFKRSTVALLDRRKNIFIKQAMVGYTEDEGDSIEQRALEVPREVIDRIFADRYRIKVIYYNQDQRELPHEDNPGVPERRTQRRRPLNEWHDRDLVLLNLKDHKGNSFGYISLDNPYEGIVPTRSTFHNLELFSRLVSLSIENYYRFSALAKKNRRLKQVLSNSNIFKLHLSLTELLNEIVWSAKYTLEFNLISLVLISKKTQLLETKAVACDDKIKQIQIRELTFNIHDFSDLLRDDFQIGKSYLVNREEPVLEHFKHIYYGADGNVRTSDGWPNWALLLVPIKGRDGKIIGFFMADDPNDMRIPSSENIHTLEILANQIAVAIDNRIMYVQAKEQGKPPKENGGHPDIDKNSSLYDVSASDDVFAGAEDDFSRGGFKKLVERFLR